MDTLLEWITIALDFDMANLQDQPGYKIRHLKCGIKLAEWCCNSIDFIKLLWQRNFHVDTALLSLYQREFMALSLKLMILRALDKYLEHKSAIIDFLKDNSAVDTNRPNGYKFLINLVMQNPLVRVKFALNSILIKLNLYEMLSRLYNVLRNAQNGNFNVLNGDLNFLIKSLNQILRVCQDDPFILSQPKRFLPVAAQFDINRCESRGHSLINIFKMHNILHCFVILLTHTYTMNKSAIKVPVYEILSELIRTIEGLRYMYNNCNVTNLLLKCLLQSDEDLQFAMSESIEVKSHNLGLMIAYKLQCLYHIDSLLILGKVCEYDFDSNDVISQLHGMFCLTFSNVGKVSVAEVLGMDNNIRCLLQFLSGINSKEKSESCSLRIRKSPGLGYIVDLVSIMITQNPNIPFLEKYYKPLLHIVEHQDLFDVHVASKLEELGPYLKPLEEIFPLCYENISPIVDVITKYIETVVSYPGQLITALRIIKYIGISQYTNKSMILSENPLSNYIELKYKHVILQLYSLDGVTLFTKMLQKICKHYEQPALHTYIFASNQSINILNCVQPVVELLKQMLTYVINCRNINFKDLTTVPVLLQTYNLLKCFPSTSPVYSVTKKVCKDVVDTLLVYTQPISDDIHEKDSLNKTLWTLMCGEVLKYITTAPYTFLSGLLIFSELLPLPLPIQTQHPLKDTEISWAINLRKLWSAHLHSHTNTIQEIVARLCTTTHPPLLNLLRRVCIQLSDLAANSAVMIGRGLLDTVHTAMISKAKEEEGKLSTCNSHVARLLNFLACLVTHSPLKCAILQLLQCSNGCMKVLS